MSKHRTGHLFKRGKNYYVRYAVNGSIVSKALRSDDGKPVRSKREAEEARTKVMAPFMVANEIEALEAVTARLEGRKAEQARLDEERNPPLPIARAWGEYLKAPNRPDSGDSTLYQYSVQFKAFADWAAKEHPEAPNLRDVTRAIAEDYATHLACGGRSANTYNKYLNLLSMVWRILRDRGRINGNGNPWDDIHRKRLTTQSRRELTIDELRKICEKAEGEMRLLLALGIYSGLRLGDCASLRWGEVDTHRGIILRVPNKTARRSAKPVRIPIHPSLGEMLKEAYAQKVGDYVLPEMSMLYQKRVDCVTNLVQKHLRDCGIQTQKPKTGVGRKRAVLEVGFHSLRHSFVSLCRESNTPLAVVESIVGHSNPAMTRHYTHVGEIAAGQAIAALPSLIGDAQDTEQAEGIMGKLRTIAEGMTKTTWQKKRKLLLAMIDGQQQAA